jgi:hypothetical protein
VFVDGGGDRGLDLLSVLVHVGDLKIGSFGISHTKINDKERARAGLRRPSGVVGIVVGDVLPLLDCGCLGIEVRNFL